jgi:hypothetical protein
MTELPGWLTTVGRIGALSNKGMKLTSVERIGRSQLIPGVRRTSVGCAGEALNARRSS